jgi:hypothetical protein
MKVFSLGFILVAAVIALPASGSAQMLSSDPISYTLGNNLNNKNGGTGFSAKYVEDTNFPSGDTIGAGLTYTHLAVSANSISAPAPDPNLGFGSISRPLTLPGGTNFGISSGTLFASFLIRPGALQSGATLADAFGGFALINNATGGTGSPIFVGDLGGFYGVQEQGGAGASSSSTVSSLIDTTAFLVLRYTFVSGADTVDLFVNPDPAAALPAVPSASISVNTDFNQIQIQQGARAYSYDEFRLGNTFQDVAPVPEPETLWLLALGALALPFALKRRRG